MSANLLQLQTKLPADLRSRELQGFIAELTKGGPRLKEEVKQLAFQNYLERETDQQRWPQASWLEVMAPNFLIHLWRYAESAGILLL